MELANHPGFWLRDDAALAFNAWEAKHGKRKVNSAGRTEGQQQHLINRWHTGGPSNRPPYLYKPAEPASTSPHVIDGGIAVDLADWQEAKKTAQEFGFWWYGSGDVVHFNFRGWNGNAAGGEIQFNPLVQLEQVFLNAARGETLDTDGKKGPKTIAAYKRYQEFLRNYGYTGAIDGTWGAGTQAAHAKYYAEWDAQRNAGRSNKSAGELTYSDIQTALNRHGYNLVVDGIWGPKSSAALADFQRRNNLTVDRIVGPNTWAKLNA